MKHILFILTLAVLSCSKNESDPGPADTKSKLIASWDAYYGEYPDGPVEGLQYAVLMNYEHGFALNQDGKYYSRFGDNANPEKEFTTSTNSGTWQVKNDTLSFTHTFQDQTDMLHFLITKLDENELVMQAIGRGPEVNPVMFRKLFLRKHK
jgi:hypothetical protein